MLIFTTLGSKNVFPSVGPFGTANRSFVIPGIGIEVQASSPAMLPTAYGTLACLMTETGFRISRYYRFATVEAVRRLGSLWHRARLRGERC